MSEYLRGYRDALDSVFAATEKKAGYQTLRAQLLEAYFEKSVEQEEGPTSWKDRVNKSDEIYASQSRTVKATPANTTFTYPTSYVPGSMLESKEL